MESEASDVSLFLNSQNTLRLVCHAVKHLFYELYSTYQFTFFLYDLYFFVSGFKFQVELKSSLKTA